MTIHDIARACGVAPSTVSRALSRPGRISPETAARINRAAESLGYRTAAPTPPATTSSSRRVVLLSIPDLTNPVFGEIARGAQETAMALDYTLQVADSQESTQLERLGVERSLPGVDGLLLVSPRMSDSALRVIAQSKPVVLLNRTVRGIPSIIIDHSGGIHRAVQHLRDLGHERLVFLAGPDNSWDSGMRWLALRQAAAELGVKVRRIGPNTPTLTGGLRAAAGVIDHHASAVIAFNDQMAAGLVRGLQQAGLSVPGDVSIVGFDNSIIAELVTPRLTSIAAPRRNQGAAGIRHLVGRITEDDTMINRDSTLPTRLTVRSSTAARLDPSAARLTAVAAHRTSRQPSALTRSGPRDLAAVPAS
ncbi:LacI family DNA-binding transcriptional regulator [Georgenia sp. MJ170]|uniref:LacI family DNA-binding transcriptional regulator n=1 Tax=Georgenia sunbinii TaxID=3117728 RepID=UPI002F266AAA